MSSDSVPQSPTQPSMTTARVARPPSPNQPLEFRKKDGSLSKMRNHNGNIPVLPQTKLCPHCPAKFTRTTHLNRHLRNHTDERLHQCDVCGAQFTRSDLLSRHRKGCNEQDDRVRRKSCVACTESKIKCDRQSPCGKCASRGKDCIYVPSSRRGNRRNGTARYPESNPSSAPLLESSELPRHLSDLNFSDATASVDQSATSDAGYSRSSLASSSHHPQSTAGTETETEAQLATSAHLTSMYNGDMFEPLFSNVFSDLDSIQAGDSPPSYESSTYTPPTSTLFPFGIFFNDFVPFQDSIGVSDLMGHSLPPIQPAVSHIRHVPSTNHEEVMDAEQRHYLHLFYTVFLENLPIVHAPTFSHEGRPPLLLKAMQACGALFLKTRQAAAFITETLATTRENLAGEFTKLDTGSLTDQLNLILAVVLLQTVGLFHQRSDQRASSSLYHGMLIMMMRRSRFLNKVSEWSPDNGGNLPPDLQWREWATHETAKRAILLTYLHDCCQAIFFGLPPSYQANEMLVDLPCENALWEAKSSAEWWIALQQTSPYGTPRSRLVGSRLIPLVNAMSETRSWEGTPPPLSPFAHFVVIHAILVRLFVAFLENPAQKDDSIPGAAMRDARANQEICVAQYSLHNWFKSWMHCPEPPKIPPGEEEPFFMQHALPFYWLGQIALMAYQEALPPFRVESDKRAEVRFRQVKQWLKHIRGFLKRTGNAPTLVWDELMRIRLQTCQNDSADDGLLGFFAEP